MDHLIRNYSDFNPLNSIKYLMKIEGVSNIDRQAVQ